VIDVRRLLAKRRIGGGDTRIDSVAHELATTARTLQRRLEQAGVSYQDLLEETLRETAEQSLLDRSLPISEVAFLLGYSEPSAFTGRLSVGTISLRSTFDRDAIAPESIHVIARPW
jgi:AraC-like DNA-binding protein